MKVRAPLHVEWDMGAGVEFPGVILENDVEVAADGSIEDEGRNPRVVDWVEAWDLTAYPLPRWEDLSPNERMRGFDAIADAARKQAEAPSRVREAAALLRAAVSLMESAVARLEAVLDEDELLRVDHRDVG